MPPGLMARVSPPPISGNRKLGGFTAMAVLPLEEATAISYSDGPGRHRARGCDHRSSGSSRACHRDSSASGSDWLSCPHPGRGGISMAPSHSQCSRRKNSISSRQMTVPATFMVPLLQGDLRGSSPKMRWMRSR